MELLLTKYCQLLAKYSCDRFLIAAAPALSAAVSPSAIGENIIDADLFTEFLLNLGQVEEGVLRDASRKKKKKPYCPFRGAYEVEKFQMENLVFPGGVYDPVKLGVGEPEEWKERYYAYYGIHKSADPALFEGAVDKVCENYLIGLKFITLYYFHGCPSWEWFYHQDFPPFLSDVQAYIRRSDFRISDVAFDLAGPVTPFEQLISILPATRADMLPRAVQPLMTNSLSQLGALIPSDYTQDLLGRDKFWQAVPILPKMNMAVVQDAYASVVSGAGQLSSEELLRNAAEERFEFKAF